MLERIIENVLFRLLNQICVFIFPSSFSTIDCWFKAQADQFSPFQVHLLGLKPY